MSEDNALEALEEIQEQLNAQLPLELLQRLLEIEREYAFEEDKQEVAFRKVEVLIDAHLRDGTQP